MSVRALLILALLAVTACRPDPYSLFLRTIEPGEEVALPDGMTLVAGERDGAVLYRVTITGPARTCDGTMEIEAEEVRVESATESQGPRLVLETPVAEERCGTSTVTTRHDRLTLSLDQLR
jgi:hypothetical protein